MKIKTGDTVRVIAGKDKGTESRVARVVLNVVEKVPSLITGI